jgi:aspartyl-tRNA(Asn)/glutamyl-tRNA(Gln) amidotransferase subunit B
VINRGERVVQETRLWDDHAGVSRSMRSKEEAHDYRYFPEPDLVPLRVDASWIESIRTALAELPQARRDRFVAEYGIPVYDADVLTMTKPLANYYEAVMEHVDDGKLASNWIMSEVMAVLKERKQDADAFIVTPESLGELLEMVADETISGKIAKNVFAEMCTNGGSPRKIVSEKGLLQITDRAAIEKFVDDALEKNADQLQDYLNGKEALFGHFVGEVMKLSKGKASPKIANAVLREKLNAKKA